MAEAWYCKIADQEVGPLSADQLRALASQGRISPNDPIRREGMDSWAPAGSVKGLFPPSNSATNAAAKPLPRAKPLVAKPLRASQPSAQPQGPKAPPTARPVLSMKSQATTPAAIPVAQPPGGLNQFSIVTDDTRPLGARGQTGGPTKIAGKKNRRRTMLLAAAGAVLAVGLAVGGVALHLSGNDGSAETSKESGEGEIPHDIVPTESSVASVNSSGTSTPSTTSGRGDSSDDYPTAAFGGEGSLRSEIPREMTVQVEKSEPDRPSHEVRETAEGENPFKPVDTESVEQEEPEEVISAYEPIPIPGIHDDD